MGRPIRLGDGRAWSLSPDGKFVLSRLWGPPPELVLLPTGAGTARKIAIPSLKLYGGLFLPDGRTVLVRASEPGKPAGIWSFPLEEGSPRLVLPDAPTMPVTSPDGKKIAFLDGEGDGFVLPLNGGPRTPLTGPKAGDVLIQWSGDGRYLFASRVRELPRKIVRIDIETGNREVWRELAPPDPIGVLGVMSRVAITRDGRSYAYAFPRTVTSDLYVLEGLK
jgi:dipeptidyl aminopeptidase/acylaminoacyl peptidase